MPGKDRILITGGFGNLGSWLTDFFLKNGYDVTVLSHRKRNFIHGEYRVLLCDLANPEECKKKLLGEEFSIVIHAASVNDTFVDDYAHKALMVNTYGTRNLLDALEKAKLRNFIYLSTFHVYGAKEGVILETSLPVPKNDYAATHLFAEFYVQQFHHTHGIPFTILRLTNSYGCPKEKDSSKWYLILNDLSRMALEKKMIKLNSNGKAQRDFLWMGDVCEAIKAVSELNQAPNDIYNLSSGSILRLEDVALAVREAYAQTYQETIQIQLNDQDKSSHDQVLRIDNTKLRGLIPFLAHNRMVSEAKSIFNFLEQN